MKTLHVLLILSAAALSPCLASDNLPGTVATANAGQALAAFHAALKSGNGPAAMALLSVDAVIYESGFAQTRSEYASAHLAADMGYAKDTTASFSGQVQHCQPTLCAIARQSLTSGKFKGRAVNSVGVETAVLMQIDGAWKITHLHWSSGK